MIYHRLKTLGKITLLFLFFLKSYNLCGQRIQLAATSSYSYDSYFFFKDDGVSLNKRFAPSFDSGFIFKINTGANFKFESGMRYFMFRRRYYAERIFQNQNSAFGAANEINEKVSYSIFPVSINLHTINAEIKFGFQALILLREKLDHKYYELNNQRERFRTDRNNVGVPPADMFKKISYEGFLSYSRKTNKPIELEFRIYWRLFNDNSYIPTPNFRFVIGANCNLINI